MVSPRASNDIKCKEEFTETLPLNSVNNGGEDSVNNRETLPLNSVNNGGEDSMNNGETLPLNSVNKVEDARFFTTIHSRLV